jgi:hypothetical protein
MCLALAGARPLTGPGVKEALEKIKMLPAASGAPGIRLRFGRFIRHGWMGGLSGKFRCISIAWALDRRARSDSTQE